MDLDLAAHTDKLCVMLEAFQESQGQPSLGLIK
jgi:hypothetical protein